MFVELREYVVAPGKLPELLARFNDHALPLFRRHRIEVLFIAQTQFGDNSNSELVYALRWESYGQMQQTWDTFIADPEWQRARADSERNGFLTASVRRRMLTSAPFENGQLAGQ
jgi:hypothetical protein